MSPLEKGPKRETSKQRTGRMRLDYYKTLDPLTRGKAWLTAAAALAALAWLSGLGWDVRQWPRRAERTHALVSPGALARAHATWEAECEACHVPFKPIDGSAWPSRFVSDARAGDRKCNTCHAAPDHHAAVVAADASCASCHREHRGREASVVVMADENCTRCHSALGAHLRPGRDSKITASVTRFDADRTHHPEIAVFRAGTPKDPGRIKFDHALHMSKGLSLQPGGRPLVTPPGNGNGVQLRCDSCHHLDGERGRGRLMKPVRYETDCRSCHPLDYDPDQPAVRHGLPLSEVHETLVQRYSARFLKDNPGFTEVRPIPGHNEHPELRAARDAIGKKVAAAEKTLFGEKRCGECHHDQGPDRLAASDVPDVWFRHAAFDHSAHTAVGCRTCHARAYPDDRRASRRSGDVILPTIAVCQTCHAPREKTKTAVTGGAGYACTECHRYHSGDAPAPAGNPLAGDAEVKARLKQFLLGTLRTHGR